MQIDNKTFTQRKFNTPLITKKISALDLGKKEPQSIEMEKAVLCAILIDKEAYDNVQDILKETTFYLPIHQKIYSAMTKLASVNQPIDIGILSNQLDKIGVLQDIGGTAYLIELTNTVASSANVEYHSRILAQKYIQRELIKLGNETIENAFDNTKDVFELLDETEEKIFNLADNYTSKDPEIINSTLIRSIGDLKQRIEQKKDDKLNGIPTGFSKLDNLLGGWQKSDFIIVAGRPGMGKTAFTLAVARSAAILGKKSVAFFSLEMSTSQIMQRFISFEAEVENTKIKKGDLTSDELQKIITEIGNLNDSNIYIDDTPSLTLMDFRKKVRKLKREKKLDLIIIDYLQLMKAFEDSDNKKKFNREQEIAHISQTLKSMAKELDIPIIALAQLSRMTEQRSGGSKKGHRPMLSDLRESGSIEQDADIVIFLYREEYYNKEDPKDNDGNSLKGLAEVIVEKHRNGETGTVLTRFIGKYIKYCDFDDNYHIHDNTANNDNMPFGFDDSSNNTIIKASKMNGAIDEEAFF